MCPHLDGEPNALCLKVGYITGGLTPHGHHRSASILMFKQVNKVINSFIGQMFMECLVDVIVLGTEARQRAKQARSSVLMTCLPYGEAKK